MELRIRKYYVNNPKLIISLMVTLLILTSIEVIFKSSVELFFNSIIPELLDLEDKLAFIFGKIFLFVTSFTLILSPYIILKYIKSNEVVLLSFLSGTLSAFFLVSIKYLLFIRFDYWFLLTSFCSSTILFLTWALLIQKGTKIITALGIGYFNFLIAICLVEMIHPFTFSDTINILYIIISILIPAVISFAFVLLLKYIMAYFKVEFIDK